jgi:hypothetical protein
VGNRRGGRLAPPPWPRLSIQISLHEAYWIRRIYRRLARRKGTGSLYGITVFIRHENVVRLLEFLVYSLE